MSIFQSKTIPAKFGFYGIHVTEYGIPAELRKNSVPTEFEIPYSAEFVIPSVRNSVFTQFRGKGNSAEYGITSIRKSVT